MKVSAIIVPVLAGFALANPAPVEESPELESRQFGGPICSLFTNIVSFFCPSIGGQYPWCTDYFRLGQCLCVAHDTSSSGNLKINYNNCVTDFNNKLR